MEDREYTLIEIIRDPRIWICEASELTKDGHLYLYRYNASEETFYRATVPSGAAAEHFQALKATDKVPLSGWRILEKREFSKVALKSVFSSTS